MTDDIKRDRLGHEWRPGSKRHPKAYCQRCGTEEGSKAASVRCRPTRIPGLAGY